MVSSLLFATFYFVIIFSTGEHRISGNKVTYLGTAQRHLLTAFCHVPPVSKTSRDEILHLLKLHSPDNTLGMTEASETHDGASETTTFYSIPAIQEFEEILITAIPK